MYDADGNRLIRTDPDGSGTLHLPDGTQVRYDQPSGTCKATRYYSHAGVTVGVRTGAGLFWLVGDHHGTAQVAVDAVSLAVVKRRMLPYGQQRGTGGGWPAGMDKGFVGGTLDPTGLTHLGAREYDPFTGAFITLDPVIDPTDPQQIHGYAYANNAPTTSSDPSGLWTDHLPGDTPGRGSPGQSQAPPQWDRNNDGRPDKRSPINPTCAISSCFPAIVVSQSCASSRFVYDCSPINFNEAEWALLAIRYGREADVDPRLILAIVFKESRDLANAPGYQEIQVRFTSLYNKLDDDGPR